MGPPSEKVAPPASPPPAVELPEVTAEPGTLLHHVQSMRRMFAIHAAPPTRPE
jgi:hypothetical protein